MDREERERIIHEAMGRGRRTIKRWIEKECYSLDEFIEITGHSRDMLLALESDGRYFGIEHEGALYWPKFQGESPPPYFEIVMGYLRYKGYEPWTIFQFWNSTGGRAPAMPNIERLREGHLEAVLIDAMTLFEHGSR